jgi:hypothetical protein
LAKKGIEVVLGATLDRFDVEVLSDPRLQPR